MAVPVTSNPWGLHAPGRHRPARPKGRADRDSSGGNSPAFHRVQKRDTKMILAGMGVKARQKWLRRMGYNIAVDGVDGPQTRAAQKAFLGGVHGPAFNHRANAGKHGPSHPQHLRGSSSAPVDIPGVPKGGGGGGGGGTEDDTIGAGLIDPMDYARGSVEAEYGPTLGQITRDLTTQRKQGKQNQTDIGSWFAQLEGTRAGGQTANKSALDAALADFRGAHAGVTNAMGGADNPGANEAAAYQNSDEGGIAAVGLAQGNFDTNMRAILASQGNDARTREHGRQSQILNDLIGKRQDLFKAKGSALSKALAEAQILRTQQRGQNIQQSSALQQLGLAKSMAPLQIAQARQGLAVGKQNAQMSQRERQLDYDVKNAQLQDFLDNLSGSGKSLKFTDLDEKDRLGVAHAIASMATGANGNVAAWNRVKQGLIMAGYDPKDPAIRRFGMGILGTLPGYKASKGFPGYKKPKNKRR